MYAHCSGELSLHPSALTFGHLVVLIKTFLAQHIFINFYLNESSG